MLLARMAGARERRRAPLREQRIALLGARLRHGICQPGVEAGGGLRLAVEECAQIMEAVAAAENENAVIAQRRERRADADVVAFSRIKFSCA